MSGTPPPPGPDVNTGGKLAAIQWMLATITAIVLILRFYVVVVLQRRIRVADTFLMLSFVRISLSSFRPSQNTGY